MKNGFFRTIVGLLCVAGLMLSATGCAEKKADMCQGKQCSPECKKACESSGKPCAAGEKAAPKTAEKAPAKAAEKAPAPAPEPKK